MPTFKVRVKWGRDLYPDVEVNTDEDPILFKAQLYALTGVQPGRQKVMNKGTILKDEHWNMPISEGSLVLLMGSKDDTEPVIHKPVKFLEDMDESELAAALDIPSGLTNLGNTCYMNATVQCLKSVPELKEALKEFKDEFLAVSTLGTPASITSAMKTIFGQLEKNETVTPILLLQTLHMAFPQFAQPDESGTYRQQDANECWAELLRMLQQKLQPRDEKPGEKSKHPSFIEQFFGGIFDVEMKCNESPDEPITKSKEKFLQLSCFISQEVKYMHSGLKSKLQETLTKRSETLGRDALYIKSSLISRLPAYLTIQFVRFQYKGKEGINAKVLKDIKFPINFDAFELCTPELQKNLTAMRSKFKVVEDASLIRHAALKDKGLKSDAAEENKTVGRTLPYWFEGDLGSNNSGYYTLQAVLTHKGRSSSSGHYVGWVRQKGDNWMKFDDDTVSPVTSDEILRLSGGGDWHCAYVLLYGPNVLEVHPDDEQSIEELSEQKNKME